MAEILDGAATPAQLAGFVVALRMKGESVDELTGLLDAMLDAADLVPLSDAAPGPAPSTSSAPAATAATRSTSRRWPASWWPGRACRCASTATGPRRRAAGRPTCWRRSASTSSSSPAAIVDCLDAAGMAFCFAPRFHPALRHAGPTRRELGIPTAFNILGPMANPARVRRLVVGVADPTLAERMLGVLPQPRRHAGPGRARRRRPRRAHDHHDLHDVGARRRRGAPHRGRSRRRLGLARPSPEAAAGRRPGHQRPAGPGGAGRRARAAPRRGGPERRRGARRRRPGRGPGGGDRCWPAACSTTAGPPPSSSGSSPASQRGRAGPRCAGVIVRVPASSANLGPGFDALGHGPVPAPRSRVWSGRPGPPAARRPIDRPSRGARLPVRGRPRAAVGALADPDGSRPGLLRRGAGGRPRAGPRRAGRGPAIRSRWPTWPMTSWPEATELEGHADNVAASLLGGVVATAGGAGRAGARWPSSPPWWCGCRRSRRRPASRGRGCRPGRVRRRRVQRHAHGAARRRAGRRRRRRAAGRDRGPAPPGRPVRGGPGRRRAALAAALDAGAWCGWLSGSGPSIAALCDPSLADAVAARAAAGRPCIGAGHRPRRGGAAARLRAVRQPPGWSAPRAQRAGAELDVRGWSRGRPGPPGGPARHGPLRGRRAARPARPRPRASAGRRERCGDAAARPRR